MFVRDGRIQYTGARLSLSDGKIQHIGDGRIYQRGAILCVVNGIIKYSGARLSKETVDYDTCQRWLNAIHRCHTVFRDDRIKYRAGRLCVRGAKLYQRGEIKYFIMFC